MPNSARSVVIRDPVEWPIQIERSKPHDPRPMSSEELSRNLDLIPSDKNLVGAAIELVPIENREYKLKSVISGVLAKYNYILIDCAPSLDLLTVNALAASDSVMVPIQCEYLALEGVSELLDTLMCGVKLPLYRLGVGLLCNRSD